MQRNATDQKKGNHALLIFLMLLIAGGISGGIISMVVGENETIIQQFFNQLGHAILDVSTYMLVLLGVLCNVGAYVIYKQQVKRYRSMEEEDIEGLTSVEKNLNIGISILSIWTILSCMLFGFVFMKYKNMAEMQDAINEGVFSVFFIFSLVLSIFIQRQMVNFIKKMNPEKQGDVLSVHFQKEWVESCDELERMIIYKAAYKAYSVMQLVYSFTFLLVMLATIYYDVSIFTYFTIFALWLVYNMIYIMESLKLSFGKKKERGNNVS